MIEFSGLSKEFSTFRREPGFWGTLRSVVRREWIAKHALRDVSARIEPGELVGVLGANGAGKTTLVKILSGIVHPTRGNVRVLGHDPWKRERDFRRRISLVMGQKAQLWWDLTPADGFELLREIYSVPRERHRRNLDELRQRLGVGDQIHTPVRRLSLGERMKMELIAALLHDPEVVYLDEPTIGLDFNAQTAIREFLDGWRRERKPVILLTSHYMKDIETLCRRIILIHEGRFVYDGPLSAAVDKLAPRRTMQLEFERPLGEEETSSLLARLPGAEFKLEDPLRASLRVAREQAREAARTALDRLPVRDFTLEEEDIGDTLGRWMKEGGRFA